MRGPAVVTPIRARLDGVAGPVLLAGCGEVRPTVGFVLILAVPLVWPLSRVRELPGREQGRPALRLI